VSYVAKERVRFRSVCQPKEMTMAKLDVIAEGASGWGLPALISKDAAKTRPSAFV